MGAIRDSSAITIVGDQARSYLTKPVLTIVAVVELYHGSGIDYLGYRWARFDMLQAGHGFFIVAIYQAFNAEKP